MKRLKISVFLLVIILILSFVQSYYVCSYSDKIIDEVKKIESLSRDKKYDEALAISRKLSKDYEKYEIFFLTTLQDEKVSELSFSFSRLTPLIEEQSDEISAETESVCEHIERIKRMEKPYWYNII